MENSSKRLVIHATLMTLGITLMLLGISWLMFFGLALVVLAAIFSSQKTTGRSLVAFLIYALSAVAFLIWDLRDGDAFVQKARPVWFWIAIVGVGIWSVIREFHNWRKRTVSHAA